MNKILTLVLAAAVFAFIGGKAWADTCETFPGSQVYTDQGCDKPYDNSSKPQASSAQPSPPASDSLRERLRRALSSGNSGGNASAANTQTADQLNQRVTDARAQIDAALADPNAPGAQQRYNAALQNLRAAYSDAAAAYPDKAALFQSLESQDEANATQRADAAGFNAPAPAANAAPPAPTGPNNVTAVGSTVYVCDGAIAGANNVSCRQISANGQCTNVTLADGGVGWQDSTTTPCSDSDLSQRSAFLAGNGDAANAVQQAPPGFSMSPAETDAEIKRLTAAPPPERDVDGPEESDWTDAMADDDTPPSIEDADAKTPIDISAMQASDDSDSSDDLDNAIDMLNAASSILGAASAIAGGGGSVPSAPSFHSAPSFRAPSAPPPQFHPAAPANNSTITGN